MKSFDQVTNEVFDRSRQHIIKVKRRNKIIAGAVSVSVCFVLCVSFFSLRPFDNTDMDRSEGLPENSIVDVTDDSSFADSTIEGEQTVRYYYTALKVFSSEPVDGIEVAQKSLDEIETVALTLQDLLNNNTKDNSDCSDNLKCQYTITFDTFDGKEETFILKGNTLSGNINGAYETVLLTTVQLEELKAMLDIS